MRIRERIKYAARASKAIAADPYEGLERTLERAAERRDRRRADWTYPLTEDFEQRTHELIGAPWPCAEDGFKEVWETATAELEEKGLAVGRAAFGGWDDADERLASTAWCLTRHMRPARVVETGVARGFTSRVVLEALARNEAGHLWSIDLPPLLEHDLATQTAAAVPNRLRDGWTLIRGSSRRRLPGIIRSLRQIDLFIHDSMHTTRNVTFELAVLWPALRPGGAVLIDDVHANAGTASFLRDHPETAAVISSAADRRALIGLLVKPAS
jgi:predicted O-methyltransferase YrrM